MSYFAVTIETIEKIWEHPDADRLELCKLEGMDFQCVVGKRDHKEGEKVLYFPLDAVIPDEVLDKMGLKGRLSGSQKNRVKTVRLRGEYSQGLVGPLSLAFKEPYAGIEDTDPKKLTDFLGVTKYEPPLFAPGGGYHRGMGARLPEGLGVYDIEGADRYSKVAEEMMDMLVYAGEKIEGSNWSCCYSIPTKQFYVNTRKRTLIEKGNKTSPYWDIFRRYGFQDFLVELSEQSKAVHQIAIYGEFIGPGVQGNYYRLKEYDVRLFDIKIDGRYLNPRSFFEKVEEFTLKHDKYPDPKVAPILGSNIKLRDWLLGKTIQEASNGQSMLVNRPREGIVIRPSEEQYSKELHGRLILKQRSPVYLAKE